MPIKPLPITAYTTVSALGKRTTVHAERLMSGYGGLIPSKFEDTALDTWIGRVEGLEDQPINGPLAAFDCRNHRLATLALGQDQFIEAVHAARGRYGAARVGVFVGTSTSGILETERAFLASDGVHLPASFSFRHTQDIFAAADFTRLYLGLEGPAVGISTACSSSAKALTSAWRHIRSGLCDAAVVGGVDSLCLTTLYGFNALGLLSAHPCRPWDSDRDGLNLGEAASFMLLERSTSTAPLDLLGYGESSDAYHMSAAHPQGFGAEAAMRQALAQADLAADDVDYINLHGTATPTNDAAEDQAVLRVFGNRVPCSSTKGWTGHTLGASGITEVVFASLCIEHNFLPATLNLTEQDAALGANILRNTRHQAVNIVISNAFGFGGSNCSVLIGRRLQASCARGKWLHHGI